MRESFLVLVAVIFLAGCGAANKEIRDAGKIIDHMRLMGAEEKCPDDYREAVSLRDSARKMYWGGLTPKSSMKKAVAAKQKARSLLPCVYGSPGDADGDGVPAASDQCPGTPSGVNVDARGCPQDSDVDGIPDYADQCPGTSPAAKVDKSGCPLDTDGDRVPDFVDQCPRTPKGAAVDARGCWVVAGVLFDTDKWDIKPRYRPILDNVVAILKNNPSLRVEIGGHADYRGPAQYNQRLSENRAKAVMYYLVRMGIQRERLSAKGYGFSRPLTLNDTEEGMARNRRVELRPMD